MDVIPLRNTSIWAFVARALSPGASETASKDVTTYAYQDLLDELAQLPFIAFKKEIFTFARRVKAGDLPQMDFGAFRPRLDQAYGHLHKSQDALGGSLNQAVVDMKSLINGFRLGTEKLLGKLQASLPEGDEAKRAPEYEETRKHFATAAELSQMLDDEMGNLIRSFSRTVREPEALSAGEKQKLSAQAWVMASLVAREHYKIETTGLDVDPYHRAGVQRLVTLFDLKQPAQKQLPLLAQQN